MGSCHSPGVGTNQSRMCKENAKMKIALIVVAVLVVAGIAFEIVSRIAAKKEKARFDKMTPDEQRKYKEEMYKRHQMG